MTAIVTHPEKGDQENWSENDQTQNQVVQPIEPRDPAPPRTEIERRIGEPRHTVTNHDGISHEDGRWERVQVQQHR